MKHLNMQKRINKEGKGYWHSVNGKRVSAKEYYDINQSTLDSDSYWTRLLPGGAWAHGHVARVKE